MPKRGFDVEVEAMPLLGQLSSGGGQARFLPTPKMFGREGIGLPLPCPASAAAHHITSHSSPDTSITTPTTTAAPSILAWEAGKKEGKQIEAIVRCERWLGWSKARHCLCCNALSAGKKEKRKTH